MLREPNCLKRECKHYRGIIQPDNTEQSEVNHCPAFPQGIPQEIAYGTNKHLTPCCSQEGEVVFEKQ